MKLTDVIYGHLFPINVSWIKLQLITQFSKNYEIKILLCEFTTLNVYNYLVLIKHQICELLMPRFQFLNINVNIVE